MLRWTVQRIGLTGLALFSTLMLNACSKQLTPEQQQAKAAWQTWVAQQAELGLVADRAHRRPSTGPKGPACDCEGP